MWSIFILSFKHLSCFQMSYFLKMQDVVTPYYSEYILSVRVTEGSEVETLHITKYSYYRLISNHPNRTTSTSHASSVLPSRWCTG
jgi:hypothetical protein